MVPSGEENQDLQVTDILDNLTKTVSRCVFLKWIN